MDYHQINFHFTQLRAVLLSVDAEELKKAVETLKQAKAEKKCVWIVGNGGSAATAGHFANDLTKMCKIKAFSIPDMVPTVTAFGNDNGWKYMFSHTMDVYFEPGDVVVIISCSGESENVLKAATYINHLIIMTGNNLQSKLAGYGAKAFLSAPSADITVQEDIHLAMCHAIVKALSQ